ncbi:MAG: cytochrome c biogenesis protein CcsA [Myxococcaceae bacterium]
MPLWTPYVLFAVILGLLAVHLAMPAARAWVWKVLAALGLVLLVSGSYLALKVAPSDREMGDVSRIMYAHLPEVWMALLALSLNFGVSVMFLFRKSLSLDAVAEASAEVGLLMGVVGVSLGSIWGRPTWGVWWDWDPRLTTSAIMLVLYSGYLALRKFVDDPDKRAVWSAVVAIIAFSDLPIVWFSVRWWRSLHQVQSGSGKINPEMWAIVLWNVAAFLALTIVFIYQRYRIAMTTREREVALPSALPPDEGSQSSEVA